MTMYRASSSVPLACLLLAACSVATPTPRVTLTRLTPDSGPIGTHVTVSGGGFTAQNNVIQFGPATNLHHPDGTPANAIAEASSIDGTTLTFDVPSSLTSGIVCDTANHCIGIAAERLQAGAYPVSIVAANGASNALVFTVTATAAPIPTAVSSSTPTVQVPTTAPTETRYRVVAKNILDANTQPFVPYGVEIPSLWVANWRSNPGMQQNIQQHESSVLYDDARNLWHANTLALKLASANLFDQSPYDQGLMNILDGVVNRAHQRGMNVILVLQYESTTRAGGGAVVDELFRGEQPLKGEAGCYPCRMGTISSPIGFRTREIARGIFDYALGGGVGVGSATGGVAGTDSLTGAGAAAVGGVTGLAAGLAR